MFCHNCGAKIEEGTKFCHSCGRSTTETSTSETVAVATAPNPVVNSGTSQTIIKCGSCAYEGSAEPARSTLGMILAWLCVFFAPLITIIYFVATHKYRCPKCKSTFLGIKNKQGVFVGQTGTRSPVIVFVCVLVVIAVIGLLSTLAVVALGSARVKARDAKRLSDLKQVQTALELYYTDQNSYPAGNGVLLGSGTYACLNANGWKPADCSDPYMGVIPTDPSDGAYVYTAAYKSYTVAATLEGINNGLHQGPVKLSPAGLSQ